MGGNHKVTRDVHETPPIYIWYVSPKNHKYVGDEIDTYRNVDYQDMLACVNNLNISHYMEPLEYLTLKKVIMGMVGIKTKTIVME